MTINKASVATVDSGSEPQGTISAEGDSVLLNGDHITSFESEVVDRHEVGTQVRHMEDILELKEVGRFPIDGWLKNNRSLASRIDEAAIC